MKNKNILIIMNYFDRFKLLIGYLIFLVNLVLSDLNLLICITNISGNFEIIIFF